MCYKTCSTLISTQHPLSDWYELIIHYTTCETYHATSLSHSISLILNILNIRGREVRSMSSQQTCVIYIIRDVASLTACIFCRIELKAITLPVAASANHRISSAALVAFSRHDPDIEAPGGLEDPKRRGRIADVGDDAGAWGMHKTATGHFWRPDRFPRGRRAGGRSAGEDTVRLSVSAWLHRGQELCHSVFYFSLGVPGTFHAAGARCSTESGVSQRGPRKASCFPESARDQDQIGPVARTSGGLSRSLPSQSRRDDLLKYLRHFCEKNKK